MVPGATGTVLNRKEKGFPLSKPHSIWRQVINRYTNLST
jgi:hypothetical protein